MSYTNSNQFVYRKLYYDTGEFLYEGYYSPYQHNPQKYYTNGIGISYYKSRTVYREGLFQRGGLLEGKEYYPSGKLKFEGRYNCRKKDRGYYGPPYPLYGKYYGEDGTLLYEGEFKIEKQGSVGYPKVVIPKGFGSLV